MRTKTSNSTRGKSCGISFQQGIAIFRFHKRAKWVSYPQTFRGGINMRQWKIVSSFDGKAPDVTLYGEYAAPDKRLFPSEACAREVLAYLIMYSARERWNSESPIYRIVTTDEQ